MDFEEMNQRAYRREATPDGLTPAEQLTFFSLALLYELHFRGAYTREQGVHLKERIRQDFIRYKAQEREWQRCQTAMKLLRRSSVPIVQQTVAEADRMFED